MSEIFKLRKHLNKRYTSINKLLDFISGSKANDGSVAIDINLDAAKINIIIHYSIFDPNDNKALIIFDT